MSAIVTTIKYTTRAVIGLGVSKIVGDIVNNNVDTDNTAEQISVAVGSGFIGYAVADRAGDSSDQLIDDIVDLLKSFRNKDEETTENE